MSRKWKRASKLAMGEFKREQLRDAEHDEILANFNGLITGVLGPINDGKEATVYRCSADPSLGVPFVAVKVYRARKFRAFSNDMAYFNTAQVQKARERKALEHRTAAGRAMAHGMWIGREWETLCRLHEAGVTVPTPYQSSPDAIAMEFVGENDGSAAPRLIDADIDDAVARRLFERLMRDVEGMLACNLIHGDLSAYNTLLARGQAVIIDVPQSIDARTTPGAQAMLERDIANLCAFFARFGVQADPRRITRTLWQRFMRGELEG